MKKLYFFLPIPFLLIFFMHFLGATGWKVIIFKNQMLICEIADTPAARQQGLMYRDSLPENYGMIFIFKVPQLLQFWMKNTFIPLSVAFIDLNKRIINIVKMAPLSTTLHTSEKKAIMAIETLQNWYQNNKIKKGDTIFILPDDLYFRKWKPFY